MSQVRLARLAGTSRVNQDNHDAKVSYSPMYMISPCIVVQLRHHFRKLQNLRLLPWHSVMIINFKQPGSIRLIERSQLLSAIIQVLISQAVQMQCWYSDKIPNRSSLRRRCNRRSLMTRTYAELNIMLGLTQELPSLPLESIGPLPPIQSTPNFNFTALFSPTSAAFRCSNNNPPATLVP